MQPSFQVTGQLQPGTGCTVWSDICMLPKHYRVRNMLNLIALFAADCSDHHYAASYHSTSLMNAHLHASMLRGLLKICQKCLHLLTVLSQFYMLFAYSRIEKGICYIGGL